MKFYRRLSAIKAISFDLDDTLYANGPIMLLAEKKMQQYFIEHFSKSLTLKFWQPFRAQAIKANPMIGHDVIALRIESYFLGFCSLGFSKSQASEHAQQAMAYFSFVRSDFSLPEHIHQLLAQLKQRFSLVAITNGNVDTKAIGINHYFSDIYHAVDGIKQKPHSEMFDHACQQLSISNNQLLHVGDCGRADIQGAINAGCQAAWLDNSGPGKALSVLPHIELTTVADLLVLT
jgi:putative hydrolase of the HAD superfamily